MDTDNSSFLGRHQFLIYRLFSLAGLIPVGAYMVVHLAVNTTVIDSPAMFQSQVYKIHALGVLLPIVEWVFIFIPILFHGLVGILIVSSASFNTASYPLTRNFRYTLQRATGMIAFAFIVWHVIHMHHLGSSLGGGKFDPHHAASSAAMALDPMLTKILYTIGMLACTYHLANGIWSFGITWGIWTSKRAQRRASYLCVGLGLFVGVMGLTALTGFSRVDVKAARQTEDGMYEHHKAKQGEYAEGGQKSKK